MKACTRSHGIGSQLQAKEIVTLDDAVADGGFVFKYSLEPKSAQSPVVEGARRSEVSNTKGNMMKHDLVHEFIDGRGPQDAITFYRVVAPTWVELLEEARHADGPQRFNERVDAGTSQLRQRRLTAINGFCSSSVHGVITKGLAPVPRQKIQENH